MLVNPEPEAKTITRAASNEISHCYVVYFLFPGHGYRKPIGRWRILALVQRDDPVGEGLPLFNQLHQFNAWRTVSVRLGARGLSRTKEITLVDSSDPW